MTVVANTPRSSAVPQSRPVPTLTLAQAIRRNVKAVADAQVTYKTQVVLVNTYVNSVFSSQLPPLNTFPPDWNDFVTAYQKAGADALLWTNQVMKRLLEVPQDVVNSNDNMMALLNDAVKNANALVANPQNFAAKIGLQNDLQVIPGQLKLVSDFITGAIAALRNFEDVLPDMAAQLTTIAQKAAADAKADQTQIDKLKADVQRLNNDIQNLTTSIIVLGIADGIALTLGIVATIAAWPVGALAWLVLGPIVAVASLFIALDAKQIQADNAAIAADQQNITGLTADVATLQLLAQNYTNMASQTQAIQAALTGILAAWTLLEADIASGVKNVQNAISDSGATNWQNVADDLNAAIVEWETAVQQATGMQITLQVNTAQLQIGQSSGSVQQALAGGKTMDVIAYYNSVAA